MSIYMNVNQPTRSPQVIIVTALFIVLLIIPTLLSLPAILFPHSFKVHPANIDDHSVQHPEFQHTHTSPHKQQFIKPRRRSTVKSVSEQSDGVSLKPLYSIVDRDATLRGVQEPIRNALRIRGASKKGKKTPTFRVEVIVEKKKGVAAVCRIENACYDRKGNLYVHAGLEHNELFLKHCVNTRHAAHPTTSTVQINGLKNKETSKKQQNTVHGPDQGKKKREDTGFRYFEDSPAGATSEKGGSNTKTTTNTYRYNETDVWTSVDFFGDFIPHKSLGHLYHFAKLLLPHIIAVQLPDHLFSRCPLLARICLSPRKDPVVTKKGADDRTSCADHREVDRNLAAVLPDSVLNARASAWMPQFFLRFKEEPIALSMDMLFPPEDKGKTLVCFNSVTVSWLNKEQVRHEWIDSFHASKESSSSGNGTYVSMDNKNLGSAKVLKMSRTAVASGKSTVKDSMKSPSLPAVENIKDHTASSSSLPATAKSKNATSSKSHPTTQNKRDTLAKLTQKIKTHVIRITVFNRAAHRPRHIANVHELRIAIDTALRVKHPYLIRHTVLSEVFYERISFAQQVAAVRNADIVIVGHGTGTAAVSSALFSKPCTLMVELYPFLVSSRSRRRNRRHYYARVNALDYAHVCAKPDRNTVFECLTKSTMSTKDRVEFRSLWKKIVSQQQWGRNGNGKGFELMLAKEGERTGGKKKQGLDQGMTENHGKQRTENVVHRHLYHPAVRHCLRKQNFLISVSTMVDLVLDWAKTFELRAKEGVHDSGKHLLDNERSQSMYRSCRAKRKAYPNFEQCPVSVR